MKRIVPAVLAALFSFAASAMEWRTNQTFYSESLGRESKYEILLPSGYNRLTNQFYPVVYFLHGRNQSEHVWYEQAPEAFLGSAHTNDLVIVFPQGSWQDGLVYYNSWYEYKGGAMASVCQDLNQEIQKKYRVKNIRGIGGLSMGGYGAMRVSGSAPSYFNLRYSATSSMSGAFVGKEISKILDNVSTLWTNELANIIAPMKYNKIYMDCGDGDIWLVNYNLAEMNMNYANCLMACGRRKNVDLVYSRPSGEHDWNYWRQRIRDHLNFFAGHLKTFPDVRIESDEQFATVKSQMGQHLLYGVAEFEEGLERVFVRHMATGQTNDIEAAGLENWSCSLNLLEGSNRIKVFAIANSGATNWSYVNLRVPKEAKPEIKLLSHKAGQKYFTYDGTLDVYGEAYADSGVSNVYIECRGKGDSATYCCGDGNVWSATVEPFLGNNTIKVFAISGHNLTNQTSFALYRGSRDFRIRKVTVNKARTAFKIYVSNITQTNLVWLAPNGDGQITFGPLSYPLGSDFWTFANGYVSNYKYKSANELIKGKIHAKPNKDFIKLDLKLLSPLSQYAGPLLDIPLLEDVPLAVRLGDSEVKTNIVLDATGKFKNNGVWY